MPNRTRKPAITTKPNDRKTTVGVGLLPHELSEFDKRVEQESADGSTVTRSTLGRKAILKYLKDMKEAA